jgi:hypothetical protein
MPNWLFSRKKERAVLCVLPCTRIDQSKSDIKAKRVESTKTKTANELRSPYPAVLCLHDLVQEENLDSSTSDMGSAEAV